MTAKQARERAHRGAKFLDEKLGRGWRRRIKRRRLDMQAGHFDRNMESGCGCVLAQLSDEGSYIAECHRLGINPFGIDARNQSMRLGFATATLSEYGLLTEAWLEELRAG